METEPIPAREEGRRFTKYLITVNSNIRANGPGHHERISAELLGALRTVLNAGARSNRHVFRDVRAWITEHPGQGGRLSVPEIQALPNPASGDIFGVEAHYTKEIGGHQRRTHIHAVVTVRHRTKLRLFKEVLQSAMNEVLFTQHGGPPTEAGIKNPYYHVKFIPSAEYYMDYIRKMAGQLGGRALDDLTSRIQRLQVSEQQTLPDGLR